MNQDENNDKSSKYDRPLIAYAFLAQTTTKPGDLLSGLAPIFMPIARQHMGQKFDAKVFSRDVAKMYGIAISPWAVDDLSPRLEQAGLLYKEPLAGSTFEYFYAEVKADFNEVSESEIRAVVDRFISFATPLLERNKLPVDRSALERSFFDELTRIDFHTIVQKPDRPDQTESTLTLPKTAEQQAFEKAVSDQSRRDVLCAAFVFEMRQADRATFDLLVRISAGALVAQVVLNMQDPGSNVSLSGLRILLDGPILMSLLDLGDETNHEYAKQLCTQLTEHGSELEVFRHSVDEIRDNLTASWHAADSGSGHGATVRRLRGSMYRSYVATVRGDLEGAINREHVRIVEAPSRPGVYQYFTQDDEDSVYDMLGVFKNPLAQQRDAASIAAIMRMRQGKHARLGQFHLAHSIFVTENPRIAECAARFTSFRKMVRLSEVPPAVTDRYLAGTLWVLFGGKANELTEYRLLASCSAALEPRNDVSSKVHKFLKQVDNKKAEHFRALMTTERSGQHLMELTLGDSGLVRSTDDADQLLAKLDEEYRRQDKEESVRAVEKVQDEAAAQVRAAEEIAEKKAELARAAEAEAILTRAEANREIDTAKREAESARNEADNAIAGSVTQIEVVNSRLAREQTRRLQEKIPLIHVSMRRARRRYIAVRAIQGSLLFAFTTGAGLIGTSFFTKWNPWLVIGSPVAVGAVAVAFFIAESWFHKAAIAARNKCFQSAALALGFELDLTSYRLNWEPLSVRLMEGEKP